jgi:hypothetical protein
VQLFLCTCQISDSELVIKRENRQPIVAKLIGKIKCIFQCGRSYVSTRMKWGTIEVVFSAGLCGNIFSL